MERTICLIQVSATLVHKSRNHVFLSIMHRCFMGDKNTNFLKKMTIRKGERSKDTKISENFRQMTHIFLIIWLTMRYWLSHIDCLPLGCFPGRMWSFKDSISHGWITHSTWIILLSNSSFTQGLPTSNLFVRLMKQETIFERCYHSRIKSIVKNQLRDLS